MNRFRRQSIWNFVERHDPKTREEHRVAALLQICELARDQGAAIWTQPKDVVSVYANSKEAMIDRRYTVVQPGSFAPALDEDEFERVVECLVSSAFISAWYHIGRDHAKRDILCQSLATLMSALGCNPREAIAQIMEAELEWRGLLREHGVCRNRSRWLIACLIVFALLITALVLVL